MHEYEWLCGWMGRGLMDENTFWLNSNNETYSKVQMLIFPRFKRSNTQASSSLHYWQFYFDGDFFLERGWPLWQAPFKNWFIQLLYFKLDKLCLIIKGNNKVTLTLNICIYTHVYIHICIIFSHSLQNFLVETGKN